MDDTAKPNDREAEASEMESPSSEGVLGESGAQDPNEREPELVPTPVPAPEPEPQGVAASLEEAGPGLDEDPLADPSAAEPALEEETEPAHPALFDATGLEERRGVLADAEPSAEPAEVTSEAPEAGTASGEEPAGASETMTLDDMVGELASESDGAIAGVPVVTETGPEIETVEGAEAGETAAEVPAASWREEAAAEVAVSTLAREALPARLPFWIYGGVWVLFVAVMTYLMWPISQTPFVGATYYSYFILGGAALLAIGPFLALAAWLSARAGFDAVGRVGLVRAVSLRAASWMAVGVALMWVSLYILDLHRIGAIA